MSMKQNIKQSDLKPMVCEECNGMYFRQVMSINKVSRLYDVSSVTYPAYNEAGSFALRSLETWQEEQEKIKLDESLEKELKEVQKEEIDLTNRNLTEMRLKVLKNK